MYWDCSAIPKKTIMNMYDITLAVIVLFCAGKYLCSRLDKYHVVERSEILLYSWFDGGCVATAGEVYSS